MKMIVGVDNLNRETVADQLVLIFPDTEEDMKQAVAFCKWANTHTCHDNGGTYYKVFDRSYRLSRGMLDLV